MNNGSGNIQCARASENSHGNSHQFPQVNSPWNSHIEIHQQIHTSKFTYKFTHRNSPINSPVEIHLQIHLSKFTHKFTPRKRTFTPWIFHIKNTLVHCIWKRLTTSCQNLHDRRCSEDGSHARRGLGKRSTFNVWLFMDQIMSEEHPKGPLSRQYFQGFPLFILIK